MSVIDDYLKDLPANQQDQLRRIRKIAKQVMPAAEETISYGMPTLKYKQKPLIHFAAFKNHLSVFPTADQALEAIKGLDKYKTSKGTLQFTQTDPIPDEIIKQIVKIRINSINNGKN